MYYPDYLIHYNKNHSAKNGQFTSGDGDGDGISNDHAHRSKEGKKSSNEQIKTKAGVDILCNKVTKQLRANGIRLAKDYSYEKFMKNSGFRKNADEMYDKYISKDLQKKISRKEFSDKLMTAMYNGMTSNTTTKVNWGRTAAIAALTGGRVLSIKRETVPVKHGELMHFNPYHDSLGRFDDAPGGLNRPGRFQEDLNYYFGSNPSINDFHISDDVMNDMKEMLHEIDGYTSTEVVKMVNSDTGEVETFLHRIRGDQE